MIREDNGACKKIIIHILTLAVVFVLAVVGFSWYLNQGTTDTTEVMAEASLPAGIYVKTETVC